VVMGKKDWNTGASKTGEVTVPEAAPLDPSNLNFILEQLGNTEAVAEASKIINQKALDEVKKADAEYFKRWQEKNAFEDKMNADRLEKIRATLANEEKLRKQGEDLTLEGDEREFKRLQEVWALEDKADQRELERIRKQIAQAEEWRKYQDSAPQRAVDEATKKVDFYKERIGFEEELLAAQKERIEAVRKLEIAAQMDVAKANQKAADETAKIDRATFDLKARQIQAGLGDMASMFQSLAGMYDKNSSEAARMQEAANAMIVLQKAVALVNAVGAVASAANAPFPAGFVAMAAMAASMVSLLSSAGISFGGGGGSGASGPAFGQNTTVFGGANNEGSESIGNSYELLKDTYDMQDSRLSELNQSMRELNANITGIVRSVLQIPGGFAGGSTTTNNRALGGALGSVFPGLGNVIGYNLPGLFGGSHTTNVTGSGLRVGAGGYTVNPYTTTTTDHSGVLGVGGRTSSDVIIGQNNAEIANMLSGPHGFFTNLRSSMVEAIKILGGDVDAALKYSFAAFDINLVGLTGDQITEKINADLSSVADNMASSLLGRLVTLYQNVGEGAFETISRLAVNLSTVTSILDMTGQRINTVGTIIREANGGFYTETAAEASIRLSESLIELAGGLDALTEASSTYYDKFFTDAEKQADRYKVLGESLGYKPTTREDYRKQVEGLDLSTESGQKQYVLFMQFAGVASDFFDVIEEGMPKLLSATELLKQQRSLDIRLMEAQGDAAGVLAANRADELAATDALLRPTLLLIYAQEDLNKEIEAARIEAERIAGVMKEKSNLEVTLMELQGNASGALAKRRELELAAADPLLRSIMLLIYAQEDLNKAYEAAAQASRERAAAETDIRSQWVSITASQVDAAKDAVSAAFDAEATNIENRRAAAIKALEAAKEAISKSYQTQIDNLNVSLDKTKQIVSDLQGYVDKLKSARESMMIQGSDVNSFGQAQRDMAVILGQARKGDLSGLKDMDKTLQSLTSIAPEMYANRTDYQRDFWATYNSISELEGIAGTQLTAEEKILAGIEKQIKSAETWQDTQLAAIDAQIQSAQTYYDAQIQANTDALNAALGINTSVLSIPAAIAALRAAIVAANLAKANYVSPNAVLYNEQVGLYGDAGYAGMIMAKLISGEAFTNPAAAQAFMQDHPELFGGKGYAYGGISSGPDSGYGATLHGTELIVSPKASYPATVKGGDNVILIEEVRKLREEIRQIGRNTKDTADRVKPIYEWDEIGMPATQV
jgi:hypothetical protein